MVFTKLLKKLLTFLSLHSYLSYMIPRLNNPAHFCNKASLPIYDCKKFVRCL